MWSNRCRLCVTLWRSATEATECIADATHIDIVSDDEGA